MPPKASSSKDKVVSVKGDEAEELVLQYLKQINRPYAATDISANLKNRVTKTNAQKILTSLAEKGSLTVKAYGKQTVFVYNQADLDTLGPEELAELDTEIKVVQDDVDSLKKRVKGLTSELASKLAQPKTSDLQATINKVEAENKLNLAHLEPLRNAASGSEGASSSTSGGPMSKDDLAAVDKEWAKWRKEWTDRKKVYGAAMDLLNPEGGPSERTQMEEDNGVEPDPEEVVELEKSELCKPAGFAASKRQSKGPVGVVAAAGDKRKRSL